ncbi:MAG: O-antigen ligase family protein, partial [Caulobacterales bacterium]|uniref:O-antigen ligase family protein n=1 Tax=Glycocaulis sp. TaxID=1969725 RepID=UPI003FA0B403
VPGFGVMQEIHPGAWKGLWWEKNTLGAMMGWAVLSFIGAAAFDERRRLIWLGAVIPALALVLLSTSRTALLASFIAIAGPGMIAMARRDAASSAIAVMTGVVGVALGVLVLVIGPGVLLEALGRDATLTGRTDIWIALMRQIAERPLLGFGYGVFWQVEMGPAHWVRLETSWPVPTAHNGWIETALATGLVGVSIAAIAYAGALTSAVMRLFRGNETYWALPFLVMWGLISFSESNLAEQNSLMWVMFTATAAKLAQPREAAP